MKKITIIDGDATIRLNVKDLLEINGFLVNEVDTIENLKGEVDLTTVLMISDVPEKEGKSTDDYFKKVNSSEAFNKIPTLFLTSSEQLKKLRGKVVKDSKFLIKPFNVDELLFYTNFIINKPTIK
ncbi:MAG: hypothetical protein JEY94_12290 [Melioribacteraceae bacterium]|nr:hypothetical protein [Melioribacteraceae bacterium]